MHSRTRWGQDVTRSWRSRTQVDWGHLLAAQGRGQHTYAFTHALETGHHMFMKLVDGRVYCLPEGYEVADRSLDAIRYVLNPTFTSAQARSDRARACVLACRLMSERRLCQVSGGAAGKNAKSVRRWLRLGQARVRYIYTDAAHAHSATLRLANTLLLTCRMHEGSRSCRH